MIIALDQMQNHLKSLVDRSASGNCGRARRQKAKPFLLKEMCPPPSNHIAYPCTSYTACQTDAPHPGCILDPPSVPYPLHRNIFMISINHFVQMVSKVWDPSKISFL